MGAGHPESPQRLRAIISRLETTGMLNRLTRIDPAPAPDEWLLQVHTASYLASLKTHVPTSGRISLDPDTSMSPGTLTAAYLAAGGALAGADAIMGALGRAVPAMAGTEPGGDPFAGAEISRNAPCPCGSGKKYKHCHGAA